MKFKELMLTKLQEELDLKHDYYDTLVTILKNDGFTSEVGIYLLKFSIGFLTVQIECKFKNINVTFNVNNVLHTGGSSITNYSTEYFYDRYTPKELSDRVKAQILALIISGNYVTDNGALDEYKEALVKIA